MKVFLAADLAESLVLGMLWIKLANLNIDWRHQKFVWRQDTKHLMATVNRIEIVEPEVYAHNATQAEASVFCLFVKPALLTPIFTELNIHPS